MLTLTIIDDFSGQDTLYNQQIRNKPVRKGLEM